MTVLFVIALLFAFGLTILIVARCLDWAERRAFARRTPARRVPAREDEAQEVGLY